jgi:hypothetical protein
MQQLRRTLLNQGLPGEIAIATEIQPNRYSQSGIPALHIHAVFQARLRAKDGWAIPKGWFLNTWQRILESFLSRKIPTKASTRIERIRRTAAGYLSKYMSKGSEQVNQVKQTIGGAYLPTTWWNMTKGLRDDVHSKTIKGLVLEYDSLPAILNFPGLKTRPILIDWQGRQLHVGYSGYIKDRQDREQFHDMIMQLLPTAKWYEDTARVELQRRMHKRWQPPSRSKKESNKISHEISYGIHKKTNKEIENEMKQRESKDQMIALKRKRAIYMDNLVHRFHSSRKFSSPLGEVE